MDDPTHIFFGSFGSYFCFSPPFLKLCSVLNCTASFQVASNPISSAGIFVILDLCYSPTLGSDEFSSVLFNAVCFRVVFGSSKRCYKWRWSSYEAQQSHGVSFGVSFYFDLMFFEVMKVVLCDACSDQEISGGFCKKYLTRLSILSNGILSAEYLFR